MKFPLACLTVLFAASSWAVEVQKEIPLWTGDAPGSAGKTAPEIVEVPNNGYERQVHSIHRPTITPFLPDRAKATGVAVLVIPGGGHRFLCVDHEGYNPAQWFAEHGIAAFVLKHRLAREEGSTYTIAGESLSDTERALRLIRSRAEEWGIDPKKLGALGFSAGGELVSQASAKGAVGDAAAPDPIDRLDSRPVFQALIYPGRSGDIQPTKESPQAFLLCSANDRQDISEGLAEAYLRFKRAGAPAELHVYATGGHGFGLRPTTKGVLAEWPQRFVEWLQSRKLLSPAP